MKATNSKIENVTVTAPSGTRCKTKLDRALQEIKDALSGKKIFTF